MAELIMDDEPVKVKDAVYDLRFGPGSVVGLDFPNQRVLVRFTGVAVTCKFSLDGRRDGKSVRSLYWRNPVVVVPPKHESTWNELRRLMETLRLALVRLS